MDSKTSAEETEQCCSVPTSHVEHETTDRMAYEEELEGKVYALVEESKYKVLCVDSNIQIVEKKRQEIALAMEKLKADVRQACGPRQLRDLECALLYDIETLHSGYNRELDRLKQRDQQKIKKINRLLKDVDTDELKSLQGENLAAHESLCSELDKLLEEEIDDGPAAEVKERACRKQVAPVGQNVFALVNIPIFAFHVLKEVSLRGDSSAMTALSEDSVALGYMSMNTEGIDLIDSSGSILPLQYIPQQCYPDISFLSNGTALLSCSNLTDIRAYSPNGFEVFTITCPTKNNCLKFGITSSDEILVANGTEQVYVYEPTSGKLAQTVATTERRPELAFPTKSGVIVTASYWPSIVTVFDCDGQRGNSISGSLGEELFIAVDEDDRIYILTILWIPRIAECRYKLSRYRLDGLDLKETAQFAGEGLSLKSSFCYLTCLSRERLALACGQALYFIQIPPP
ncbi:uncharacterized protein [Diadema antillarum]|uniref:uncharacterized protein n=1 Tax=Diadema antillarum TaxID=105358 RepID=UPI003A881217